MTGSFLTLVASGPSMVFFFYHQFGIWWRNVQWLVWGIPGRAQALLCLGNPVGLALLPGIPGWHPRGSGSSLLVSSVVTTTWPSFASSVTIKEPSCRDFSIIPFCLTYWAWTGVGHDFLFIQVQNKKFEAIFHEFDWLCVQYIKDYLHYPENAWQSARRKLIAVWSRWELTSLVCLYG